MAFACLWALVSLLHIFMVMNVAEPLPLSLRNSFVGNSIVNYYAGTGASGWGGNVTSNFGSQAFSTSSSPTPDGVPTSSSAAKLARPTSSLSSISVAAAAPTTTTSVISPVTFTSSQPPPAPAANAAPAAELQPAVPATDPQPAAPAADIVPNVTEPQAAAPPATDTGAAAAPPPSRRRRDIRRAEPPRPQRRQTPAPNSLVGTGASAPATSLPSPPFLLSAGPAVTGVNMLFLGFGFVAALFLPIARDLEPESKTENEYSMNAMVSNDYGSYKKQQDGPGYSDYNNQAPAKNGPPTMSRTMAFLEGNHPDAPARQDDYYDDGRGPPSGSITKGGNDEYYGNNSYSPNNGGNYKDDSYGRYGAPGSDISGPRGVGSPQRMNNEGMPSRGQLPDGPGSPLSPRSLNQQQRPQVSNGRNVPPPQRGIIGGVAGSGAGAGAGLYGDDDGDEDRESVGITAKARARDTLYTVAGGEEYDSMSESSYQRSQNGSMPRNAGGMGSAGRMPPGGGSGARNYGSDPRQQQGGDRDWDRNRSGPAASAAARGQPFSPAPASASTPNPAASAGGASAAGAKKEPKVRCKTCGEKMVLSLSLSHVCPDGLGPEVDGMRKPPPAAAIGGARAPPPMSSRAEGSPGGARSPPQASPAGRMPPGQQQGRDERPAPGKRMKVVRRYNAKLDDEMYLEVDDVVDIEDVFEDGWGFGVNGVCF
ncbi:hypothetical protein HK101_003245 [Irineochytrium annulatum]|nr:hypothetical protein HK101_003245 [Irineochytrium annulatum]